MKRLAGEATQFCPLVRARQLQALVRRHTLSPVVEIDPDPSNKVTTVTG